MKRLTQEEFITKVNKKYNGNIVLETEYINSREKIKCHCIKHDKHFNIVASGLLRKNALGCDECVKENLYKFISFTDKDFCERINEVYGNNITILSKYSGSHNDITARCNVHNTIWKTKAYVLLRGNGCCKCKSERNHSRQITPKNEFIDKLKLISPHINVIGIYDGMKVPILCKCTTHNIEWSILPSELIKGSGCKLCGIQKIKYKGTLSKEDYNEKLKIMNPDIEVIGAYINTSVKTRFVCKKCNNEWLAPPCNLIYGNITGCPHCQEYSKGETAIRNFLTNNNIDFILHHTFVGLNGCGNKPLSYDFYLPEFNILVEFQGIQHEKPIKFSKSITDVEVKKIFKRQQEHDRRKQEYAKLYNIKLLEIWYYDVDNINQILNKELYNSNN